MVLSNICIVKAEPFHSIQQTSDFFITGLVYVWNLKEKWDTAKDQGPGARDAQRGGTPSTLSGTDNLRVPGTGALRPRCAVRRGSYYCVCLSFKLGSRATSQDPGG